MSKTKSIIISSSAIVLLSASFSPALGASAAFQKHYDIGKSFLVNQNYDMAITEFDAALHITPKSAEALVDRGTAYNGLGKYNLAVKDFKDAIAIDPKNYLAHNNEGVAYLRLNDPAHAIACFDKAIAINNKEAFAYLNRGGASLSTLSGDSAQQLADWLKRINWTGNYCGHGAILSALGFIAKGEKSKAKAVVDDALAKTDRLKWPYPFLKYLSGKAKFQEVMEEAESSDYDSTQAHCFIGIDLCLKKDPKLAQSHFAWVLKNGTRNSVEFWVAKKLKQ